MGTCKKRPGTCHDFFATEHSAEKYFSIGGRAVTISVGVVFFCICWIGWPYYALFDLAHALKEGDTATLENRIAWDSVRQGLRGDFNAIALRALNKDSSSPIANGLAAVLGPTIINQMIDSYVTPQAIGTFIRTGKLADAKPHSAESEQASSKQSKEFSLDQVEYAFFSGGPFTFKVEVAPTSDDPSTPSPLTLIFKWNGDWKLTKIIPPSDLIDKLKSGQIATRTASQRTGSETKAATTAKIKEPTPFEVTLARKGFRDTDYRAGEYEKAITIELSIRNLTEKNIRAFDGVLSFTDLLDNEVMSSKLAINDLVRADTPMTWKGEFKYNQFIDSHQRLRNASKENLKINFTPRKILFEDGSTKEYN